MDILTKFIAIVTIFVMIGSMAIAEQVMKANQKDLASNVAMELSNIGY